MTGFPRFRLIDRVGRRLCVALPGSPSAVFSLSVGSGGTPFAPCHGRIGVTSLAPAL